MAEYRNRLLSDVPRTPLETVIPLPTPFVVLIDPASACNLRCKFCPTGDTKLIKETGRFQGYMELALFEKLIGDLDEFQCSIKTVRLYKEGEPLVNPCFADFVRIAKQSKKVDRVDTITNGLLLKKNLSERIIDAGLDLMVISINGMSSVEYFNKTGVYVDTQKLVDEVRYLYSIRGGTKIYIKCIGDNFSDDDKKKFIDTYSPICDYIFIENLQPNWPNFSFDYINVNYKYGHLGQHLEDKEVCPYIFYSMVVNSDGSVSACVQDWQHKLLIGDARNETLFQIWTGNLLKNMQIKHLNGTRCEIQSCAVCPVLKHGTLDNIDLYREQLLEKFKK